MMALLKSRTLSVSINCDPRSVYKFVSKPENLPRWARMFCRTYRVTLAGGGCYRCRKEIAAVAMTIVMTATGNTHANTWIRDMAPAATIAPPT